ncbi:alpha/beta hydrolase fold protein [Ophiocordyceps camponoti-floridani]|uniref:Alpha/beta hydrolase fold protein n=1 Tax=Ophiocordyceps camponoti-floridani TaxID=2030778 RepID=A0A8H4Q2V6_9HYPO|nr:alpha/beta hydrolase fold protein [Ophiocordyceps camponoti-floridani]
MQEQQEQRKQQQQPRLTATEKLMLIIRILTLAPLKLPFYAAKYALFAIRNRLPLRPYLGCAAIRFWLNDFSARELQYIQPGTQATYEDWARKKQKNKAKVGSSSADQQRIEPDVQPLADDGAILWIGNRKKASKVVLFFHGGGFCVPANPGHFEWCWNAYVQTGVEAGVEVAVAFLRYSLSPGANFPVQLRQQVAALKSVLESGIGPGDIIIGGDSAGGNLVTQLLGHILHPHSDVEAVELSGPLSGAFAVSPWLFWCDPKSQTYRTNEANDMLVATSLDKLALSFFGNRDEMRAAEGGDNGWVAPLHVDASWFTGINGIVSTVYVTVGKREVLLEDARGLTKRLEMAGCEVRLDEADDEAHDFIYLEGAMGEVGDATRRMKDWFGGVIRGISG